MLALIKKYRISKLKMKILSAICISEVVVIACNKDFNVTPYISLFLMITAVAFVSEIMSVEEYEHIYINVSTALAFVSLIAFGLGILFPQYVYLLPKTNAVSQCDYYNAIVHVYNVSKELGTLELRNNSIFWEGGCCQAFFSLGLMMQIKNIHNAQKSTWISMIILCAGVMSTFSFTGYFILGLIALVIFYNMDIGKKLLLCMLATVGAAMLFMSSYGLYFVARFGYYVKDINRILERLGLEFISKNVNIFMFHGFLGISFQYYLDNYGGSNNSIIYYTMCLGGIFAGCIMFIYWKYIVTYQRKHRFLVILILVAIFSTESLLLKPTFLLTGLLCVDAGRKSIVSERRYNL
ncbi:MAG: hypothetical protein ACI4UK_04875 [Floccifex sp.]